MLNIIKKNINHYKKIYVLSDLHGSFDLLKSALEKIEFDKQDLMIINGDSCDRGPNTPLIYESVLGLIDDGFEIIHLLGNHESMFLNFLHKKDDGIGWYMCGGGSTLSSYKNNIQYLNKHLNFISQMPHVVEIGDYLILHAGVNPEKSLENQNLQDIIWIRDEFIGKKLKKITKTIIYGHTPNMDGKIHYLDNNSISIDCGSYINHKIGILELKSMKEYYVSKD